MDYEDRINMKNIPMGLKQENNWLLWRAVKAGARTLKQPKTIQGNFAQINNPKHLLSYQSASNTLQHEDHNFTGLGYNLTFDKTDLVVLDLDKCIDDSGELTEWAINLVVAAESYTEYSPSGRGLRIISRGVLPGGDFISRELGVECYVSGSHRYVTITGMLHDQYARTKIEPLSIELIEELSKYRPIRSANDHVERPVTDLSTEEIFQILKDQPEGAFERYDDWLRLGFAIHHQFDGGQEGLEMWDALSRGTSSYSREEIEAKWDGFGISHQGNSVTIRSFFPKGMYDKATVSSDEFPIIDDVSDSKPADDPDSGENDTPAPVVADTPQDLGVVTDYNSVSHEIVEDWLALHEVSCWTGAPGSMKTMCLLDLAYNMAVQPDIDPYTEWAGRLVVPGGVLWLAYEGLNAVKKRLRGYQVRCGDIPKGFHLVDPQESLSSKNWSAWIDKLISQLGPKMIVIDTLAASTPGIDENSNEDMSNVAGRMRLLAQRRDVHVAYIHHSSKGGADVRGAGVLEGDLDTLVKLTKNNSKRPKAKVEVKKQRNLGSTGEAFMIRPATIHTGLKTSFDRPEVAPYMVLEMKHDASSMSIEHQKLRGALVAAMELTPDGVLDSSTWIEIKDNWVHDNFGDLSNGAKNELKEAKVVMRKNGIGITEKGNGHISQVYLTGDIQKKEKVKESAGSDSWE